MSIEAMLFDLDGTLLDTLADIANSLNLAFIEEGLQTHSVEAFRGFVGNGVFELVRAALPQANRDDENVARIVEKFRVNYAKGWAGETVIYPGIEELLAKLRERGVKTCVLSNKPDDFTREMVRHFFPEHPFTFVMGHHKGFPAKPDPASTLHMIEQMGISREKAAYVGDMHVDIQTALNAGILPVGVSWGFCTKDALRQAGAEIIVDRAIEILNLSD